MQHLRTLGPPTAVQDWADGAVYIEVGVAFLCCWLFHARQPICKGRFKVA